LKLFVDDDNKDHAIAVYGTQILSCAIPNPSLGQHSHSLSTARITMAATSDLTTAVVPTSFRNAISKPVVASFMAGGVAGAVSRTVVSPLERLKILQQIQAGARNQYQLSIWKALGKMWKEEGWRGFMAGNGTNCVRIVPYSAVQFGSYNFYKRVRRSAYVRGRV